MGLFDNFNWNKKSETVILTNMCMVYDGDKILVQNRASSNWPGITFPGGHVEYNESFVQSAIREVKEETGLDVSNLELCGVEQWTAQEGTYRYIAFLYKTNNFKGEIKSSREGEILWINKNDLNNYQLSDGFAEMFKVFENDNVSEAYAYLENDWQYKYL